MYGNIQIGYIFNFFVALTLGTITMVSTSSGHDLKPYQWKNRVFLVFSPTDADPAFKAFNQSISREVSEMKRRDLIVLRIFETGPSFLEENPLLHEDAENLRDRFRVKPGRFCVILVGKDGGVKMVREDRAELQEFFDLIDSMPMRQKEMRQQDQAR